MGVSGMKKSIVFLVMLLLVPSVLAQENEVCLVYFTGYACGDDCGLTDTFMDGLINEYSYMLTAIRYYTDASQENENIFEAYRYTYDLPSGIPLVLFGENDYLLGRNDIYKNTESKILTFLNQNGTNCPLESGYIPPGDLNPSDLPGEVEVFESEEPAEEDENETTGDATGLGDVTENVVSVIEDVVESEHFPLWIFVTAIFIIIIVVTGLAFGTRRMRK
jgi:hypothetical protein